MKNLSCCMRILNVLYSRVLTKHSVSSAHDYTTHSQSTVQSCADKMNRQYTVWKHMEESDRPQMTICVS
jgi:hypothetical protein